MCGFVIVSVCGTLVVVDLVAGLVFECRDVANNVSSSASVSVVFLYHSFILNGSCCVLCV